MIGRIGPTRGLVRLWKGYSVPAGKIHNAMIDRFSIFANVERWQDEPTSAAEDFTAV